MLLVSACSNEKVIHMRDYGIVPDTEENLSAKMQEALTVIKQENEGKKVTLLFDAGRYEFHAEGAVMKEYYISNHDQPNPKPVGLALEDWNNLTLDGGGADFIFYGRMLPMSLVRSNNTVLKNFSIDFEEPHIAQVEIVESTKEGIIFRTEPWVKAGIGENGHFENRGEGWKNYPQAGIAFDAKTRHLIYQTSDLWCPTNETKQLDERTFQTPSWKDSRLVPGTKVALRTWDRPAPGIFMHMDKDTRLENITVHYAEGMGLLAQISENITLEKFNVCLRGDDDARYSQLTPVELVIYNFLNENFKIGELGEVEEPKHAFINRTTLAAFYVDAKDKGVTESNFLSVLSKDKPDGTGSLNLRQRMFSADKIRKWNRLHALPSIVDEFEINHE